MNTEGEVLDARCLFTTHAPSTTLDFYRVVLGGKVSVLLCGNDLTSTLT